MRELLLTNGLVSAVDVDVFEWARLYRWSLGGGNRANHTQYVARRTEGTTAYLHRLVMGAGPDEVVDHRDGDRLNNQRANLRLVTHGQNQQNRRRPRNDSRVGVRGVQQVKGKYYIAVTVDGLTHRGGRGFRSLAEASIAVTELRKQVMPFCEHPASDLRSMDEAAIAIAEEAVAEWQERVRRLELELESARGDLRLWIAKLPVGEGRTP